VIPWTLTQIEAALRDSWASDTCSPDDVARGGWTSANPAWGHCDVTALILNDIFGGDLVLADVYLHGERYGSHWWNRLAGGVEIDLTREQFRHGQDVGTGRIVRRPAGPTPRRWSEYQLLRRRVEEKLGPVPASR
jgi:hypothetical protein